MKTSMIFLQIHQHSEQKNKLEITKKIQSSGHKRFVSQKSGTNSKDALGKVKKWMGMDGTKFRGSFVYAYNCVVGCTCHEKNLSTAPLRATLGTLRAGSPFRVLPQPSLEGMSALSAPSASRTQPYG